MARRDHHDAARVIKNEAEDLLKDLAAKIADTLVECEQTTTDQWGRAVVDRKVLLATAEVLIAGLALRRALDAYPNSWPAALRTIAAIVEKDLGAGVEAIHDKEGSPATDKEDRSWLAYKLRDVSNARSGWFS